MNNTNFESSEEMISWTEFTKDFTHEQKMEIFARVEILSNNPGLRIISRYTTFQNRNAYYVEYATDLCFKHPIHDLVVNIFSMWPKAYVWTLVENIWIMDEGKNTENSRWKLEIILANVPKSYFNLKDNRELFNEQ